MDNTMINKIRYSLVLTGKILLHTPYSVHCAHLPMLGTGCFLDQKPLRAWALAVWLIFIFKHTWVKLVSEPFFFTEFDLLIKHFEAFCNNIHIWYTNPGFCKPSIWAWPKILKAQAHQSQTQYITTKDIMPSWGEHQTVNNMTHQEKYWLT